MRILRDQGRYLQRNVHLPNFSIHHQKNICYVHHVIFFSQNNIICLLSLFATVVSYQIESFSSKWELPSLLSPFFITRGRMRASRAALILMKISHFDRTPLYIGSFSYMISPKPSQTHTLTNSMPYLCVRSTYSAWWFLKWMSYF